MTHPVSDVFRHAGVLPILYFPHFSTGFWKVSSETEEYDIS